MMSLIGSAYIYLAFTVAVSAVAFWLSVNRVQALAAKNNDKPHSRINYYGVYALSWTLVPAILLALVWGVFADPLILRAAEARIFIAYPDLPPSFIELKLAQLENIANGAVALSLIHI